MGKEVGIEKYQQNYIVVAGTVCSMQTYHIRHSVFSVRCYKLWVQYAVVSVEQRHLRGRKPTVSCKPPLLQPMHWVGPTVVKC